MRLTAEKFEQGMTTRQYIDQIKVNKQPFVDIYDNVEVAVDVRAQFDGLDMRLKLAVFTADWCGDAMSTTPTILRLADYSFAGADDGPTAHQPMSQPTSPSKPTSTLPSE